MRGLAGVSSFNSQIPQEGVVSLYLSVFMDSKTEAQSLCLIQRPTASKWHSPTGLQSRSIPSPMSSWRNEILMLSEQNRTL